MSKTVKPFQPDRKDLLINTDFGIPQAQLTKEGALKKGLKLFKGKWVTKEEKLILSKQLHTYGTIRACAWLSYLAGILTGISGLLALASDPSSNLFEFVMYGVLSTAYIITGRGLQKYKNWARWSATILLVGGIFFPLCWYYLHNRTARQIFKGKEEKAILSNQEKQPPTMSKESESDVQKKLSIAQECFEKGAEFAKLQKWQQAIEAFKEAVRINPKHSRAHMGLCLAYAAILDLDTARHHYEILKQIDPDLAEEVANTPAGIMILRGNIIQIE